MDPLTVSLLSLRGMATLFSLQGKPEVGYTIDKVLNAYQAGKNVDAHMAAIAAKLESGIALDDWTDIQAKIDAEIDDFLDEAPGPE